MARIRLPDECCNKCGQRLTWKTWIPGDTTCRQCHTSVKVKANFNKVRARRYGIHERDILRLYELQGHECAICTKPISIELNEVQLGIVDHNHTTDKVRGLLCYSCNTGIGLLGDNPTILKAALSYIENDGIRY